MVVFDADLAVIHQETKALETTIDEDGFVCDDLEGIVQWIEKGIKSLQEHPQFALTRVNFTTYGASWVHLDRNQQPVTPIYNYLKPFPDHLKLKFDSDYGLEHTTYSCASPFDGMLNSGLQLYWLKYEKPALFQKINRSLHLPQYLSHKFSGNSVCDFTSLGCHTALWNFERQAYHHWVTKEGLEPLFPSIVPSHQQTKVTVGGQALSIGAGIHDSSASLHPYRLGSQEPFLLLSTGTWSVALNPFSDAPLDHSLFEKGGLCYLQPNGTPVRASRLFLGHEYRTRVKHLAQHYNKQEVYFDQLTFDIQHFNIARQNPLSHFHFESFPDIQMEETATLNDLYDSSVAYHQLVWELVKFQIDYLKMAIGSTPIRRMYVEGGFAHNDVFLQMLAHELSGFQIFTANAPMGTALGAALVMRTDALPIDFLTKTYGLNLVKPWN